ncbi:hypothetical protein, partial [Streptococcus ruminantium]|uniref:hypothetical protein n=1 Tax=Streptococcus ruminantium TaxID=1917441 RepID=UPI001D157E63
FYLGLDIKLSFFLPSFFMLLYFFQIIFVILILFLRKSNVDFLLGVWGRSHQVILSSAIKTQRFWSAGDKFFGILWTQYLSSQKPKRETLRLLGSPRIRYGIGANPIGGNVRRSESS